MRRYFYLFILAASTFSACNNSSEDAQRQAETAMSGTASEAPTYRLGDKTDPVCQMEWDAEWTDSTVYKNETVRFCSEGCKMAFEARPEKYIVPSN